MNLSARLLVAFAGLAGLSGVGLSAAAAHSAAGANLDTAARFLLIHAAALIGLVALAETGLVHPFSARIAAWALVLGLALFAGDLVIRAFRGVALFPMAAPTGGIALMVGWGLVILSALLAAF